MSGFLPFTVSAHVWTAIVLRAIVGAVGLAAFAHKLDAKGV